jgi:hypothetical protein
MNKEVTTDYEQYVKISFENAKSYSQVVLGIGYVSIFAAWGFTKDYLTRGEVLWSALLVCISIAFFILVEVFTTFINSRNVLKLAKAVQKPQELEQNLVEINQKNAKWALIYSWVWMICWPISFGTGIASGGILIWAFITHLWSGK